MRAVVITVGWVAMTLVHAAALRDPSASGSRETVSLQLVTTAAVSKVEIDGARDQLTRIWRPVGIDVDIAATVASAPDLRHQGQVRLVLSDAAIRVGPSSGSLCALGVIHFVDGLPQPEMTVSVTRVRDFVRRARPEQSAALQSLLAARIIGRVAAHELGHYLVADTSHRESGLMRARFDGADLLAPHLQPFAAPERHELGAGLSHLNERRAKSSLSR
jgi:hypothetical protein